MLRWGWFQEGRFLGRVLDEWIYDSQEFIHTKLPRLIVIAIIAFVLSRLLKLVTSRMTGVAEQSGAGPGRFAEVKTMAGVINATGLAIIGLIAALQALDSLGFNLAPLLASAGVAGIAIGLAAQNIVKDMFNGMLFLVEGQFNVGDAVRLAGLSGTVESMTLRKTSVRDADGTLYIIPNSQITTVANLSADFSVATVNVSVDFSAHPDDVTKLLKQIAMDVRNSDAFKDVFFRTRRSWGWTRSKARRSSFPLCSRPKQPSNTARCANSSVASGLLLKTTACFPAIRIACSGRRAKDPPRSSRPRSASTPTSRPSTPPPSSRRSRTRSPASSATGPDCGAGLRSAGLQSDRTGGVLADGCPTLSAVKSQREIYFVPRPSCSW